MANSNGTVTRNDKAADPGPKPSLAWLDIRVFYVRISRFAAADGGCTPEYLTLSHVPLDPNTMLEVNGKRCGLHSDGSSCRLHRNRVDKRFEEATFVSTDGVRVSGSVQFQVFDGDDVVLSGALEMSENGNGFVGESGRKDGGRWGMRCEPTTAAATRFLKGDIDQGSGSGSGMPKVEVYVAGSFSGTPIVLTKALRIGGGGKKQQRQKGVLGTIPEGETAETQKGVDPEFDLQAAEYGGYEGGNEYEYDGSRYLSRTEYMDGEDGELSWFNAGLRVGVGLGLGICLGVGVGVSLMVRTYQSTIRNFRRRLL